MRDPLQSTAITRDKDKQRRPGGPPPPSRRLGSLALWFAMVASVAIYLFVAFSLSRTRSGLSGASVLPDYINGSLLFAPYLLPFLLYPIGSGLYDSIALPSRDGVPVREGKRPQTEWRPVLTGFLVMLAVFESNVLIGLTFFFAGSPIEKFVPFAIGTLFLQVFALRRLVRTWPPDDGG